MLAKLFELFQKNKKEDTRRRPLTIATHYKSAPASQLFNTQAPDVSKVYENASKLPLMRDADLSFCIVSSGVQFVGFNRPKRVCGYIVVYPMRRLRDEKTRLFRTAQQHGLNVGKLVTTDELKCIRVRRGDKFYFLVDPGSLRLRDWTFRADTSQAQQTTPPIHRAAPCA